MNIDKTVFAVAGAMILLTVCMAVFHTIYWLWFTAFIGANLFQAGFTGFCPLVLILKRLGLPPGKAF
ncbi:Protein of unknown function [Desulfocicer vacuolatum DSM 3385]|uniref:Inner membrane protein YgaP-like transmembrane domain-containing protein n=1 Tax=Desulfocicer vacuolatum DSM 3385 TaxID=1121400 RepID=A0A1W2DEQ3_9BACT|nr:DUF2892 domain-containing protein [Desulfocicer vacuolatum]SMC95980.1 Protein of unknown function [Desulfocicer vacuolatum DSM 3385]